jgi:hypothetical protein
VGGCVSHGGQWIDTKGSFIYTVAQTCNSAYLCPGDTFASETSGMCAQAVAYQVEIRQFCSCLRHEEKYQIRYVPSSHTCIRNNYVVVSRGVYHFIGDGDDVVIASSQISWKGNSTWL